MPMKNPPHPRFSVKHDCLDPLGLTVTAAAKLLGVTRQTLNDLVHARRGISPEMAIRLDLAFGGGADTWLRMQAVRVVCDLVHFSGIECNVLSANSFRQRGEP
jgi:antitoxin HigA-1